MLKLSPWFLDDVNFRYPRDVTKLFTLEIGDDFFPSNTPRFHLNCFSEFLTRTYGLSVDITNRKKLLLSVSVQMYVKYKNLN